MGRVRAAEEKVRKRRNASVSGEEGAGAAEPSFPFMACSIARRCAISQAATSRSPSICGSLPPMLRVEEGSAGFCPGKLDLERAAQPSGLMSRNGAMDLRAAPRRTLVAHARPEAFAIGTRLILGRLGYEILDDEDFEVCILLRERTGDSFL